MRVPYKIGRRRRYWPDTTATERRAMLAESWRRIVAALELRVDGLVRCLPHPEDTQTLAALKGYEDALDACVCAWVGAFYLAGGARAYGDDSAAIWIPS